MPQDPNLASVQSIDIALRDAVAREIFGVNTFAALAANFQTELIDLGNDAFYEVTNLARWYDLVDPAFELLTTDDLPGAFNEVFKVMWIARGVRRFRSHQDGHIYMQQVAQPLLQRTLETHDPSFNSSAPLAGRSVSLAIMRRAIIGILVRQRTPIFPPLVIADQVIYDEFVKMWEGRRWTWKIRAKRATITTQGDFLLPAGDTDVFDGLASKNFILRLTNGQVHRVSWLDPERFTQAQAHFQDVTGRPRYFSDEDHGNIQRITFLPTPDQNYTAYASIIRGPPSGFVAAASQVDPGLTSLPLPFRAALRDLCIASLANKWGREDNDATRLYRIAREELAALGPKWEDKGASRSNARGHHHLNYINDLRSYDGTNTIGNLL